LKRFCDSTANWSRRAAGGRRKARNMASTRAKLRFLALYIRRKKEGTAKRGLFTDKPTLKKFAFNEKKNARKIITSEGGRLSLPT
jgi:hypothetical protein